MGYNYNQATLVGRLTRDPEARLIGEDLKKSMFTLAVNRPYQREEGKPNVDFIPISMWGKNAERALKVLHKGTPVLVSGKIQVRTWEKEDKKFWSTEVIGEKFQVLGLSRKKVEELSQDPIPEEVALDDNEQQLLNEIDSLND